MSEINDRTLKNVPRSRDNDYDVTLRRSPIHHDREDTESTAPTMALGWEGDRMSEVRPYAHIPGKRKAPKAPEITYPEELGATALEPSLGLTSSEAKFHSGLNIKSLMPDQPSLGPVSSEAKIHSGLSNSHTKPILMLDQQSVPSKIIPQPLVQQVVEPEKPKDSPLRHEQQQQVKESSESDAKDHQVQESSKDRTNDIYVDRYEPVEVQSPKPWYKKKPFSFDKVSISPTFYLRIFLAKPKRN